MARRRREPLTPGYEPQVKVYEVTKKIQNYDSDHWAHWIDTDTLFTFSTEEKAQEFLSKCIAAHVKSCQDYVRMEEPEYRAKIEAGMDEFSEDTNDTYAWYPVFEIEEDYIY